MTLPLHMLPGPPGDAGMKHGREIAHFFDDTFLETYLARLSQINRVQRSDMPVQAQRWLASLPTHFQEEVDGMAVGAGVPALRVAEFLYADISRPTNPATPPTSPADPVRVSDDEEPAAASGPMCTGVMTMIDRELWIARNCDWLFATLVRGTAAVVHASPGRIPVMGVGIRGDIDVDTGINAERLWVHLHTLYATDEPRGDRTCISWLFWAREALETCASLDDLERFITSTQRDRGVIVVAGEGKSGDGAIFECSRAGHERHDFDGGTLIAANHPQRKNPTNDAPRRASGGTTTSRWCGARDRLSERPPTRPPEDLIAVLADDRVEMRTPPNLRTIYSAVVCPRKGDLWFAAGGANGQPAASSGRWVRAPLDALSNL